jgi:hypothetical protein
MGAASGQYGTVHIGSSELLEVQSWKFSRKAAVHQYASNTTGGHKKTVTGVKSGSGSISGAYDPDDPVDDHIEEGDSVTAKLYTTATKYYTVPMVIENLDLEVDLDEGDIIGWEASFVADGAWTKPA